MSKTTTNVAIAVRRENGKIWSHIRQKWLVETPEERVRQEYLCVLVNEYEFAINQIAEARLKAIKVEAEVEALILGTIKLEDLS